MTSCTNVTHNCKKSRCWAFWRHLVGIIFCDFQASDTVFREFSPKTKVPRIGVCFGRRFEPHWALRRGGSHAIRARLCSRTPLWDLFSFFFRKKCLTKSPSGSIPTTVFSNSWFVVKKGTENSSRKKVSAQVTIILYYRFPSLVRICQTRNNCSSAHSKKCCLSWLVFRFFKKMQCQELIVHDLKSLGQRPNEPTDTCHESRLIEG